MLLGLSVGLYAQEEVSLAKMFNDGYKKATSGEYKEALSAMEKVLEKADPEADKEIIRKANIVGAKSAYAYGGKLRKAEDYEAAVEVYDKGIEMMPNYYQNHLGRSQALEGAGKVEAAIESFLKTAELTEKSSKPEVSTKADKYYRYASNMVLEAYNNDNLEAAIQYGNTYLEHHENANVHYYMANAHNDAGNPGKGLEHAEKAIETAEEVQDKYYLAKGIGLEGLGRTDEAIQAYQMVKEGDYAKQAEYRINQLQGGR